MYDLAYFFHNYLKYFCSARIRKDFNRGGANYSDKFIKLLQGLVWRSSYTNRLNQTFLVNTNLARYEADEWYFEAEVEVEKLKKEFEIDSPGKLVYAEWRKWNKAVENFFSTKFNLTGTPLAYVISRGRTDKPKILKNAEINCFLLELFDVVYT